MDPLQYTLKRIASEILTVFPDLVFEQEGDFGFSTTIGNWYELEAVGSSLENARTRGHSGVQLALHRTSVQALKTLKVPLLDVFQPDGSGWTQDLRTWLIDIRKQILDEVQGVLTACTCHLTCQAFSPQAPSGIPRLLSLADLVKGPLTVVLGKTGSGKSTVIRHIIRDCSCAGSKVTVWTSEMTTLDLRNRLQREYPELNAASMGDGWLDIIAEPDTEVGAWLALNPGTTTLVLLGPSMTGKTDWYGLAQAALKHNVKIVVEVQARREATSLDALSFHLELASLADQVIWVDSPTKPLNVIKHRDGSTGPIWRPVVFKRVLLPA